MYLGYKLWDINCCMETGTLSGTYTGTYPGAGTSTCLGHYGRYVSFIHVYVHGVKCFVYRSHTPPSEAHPS